MGGTGGVRVAVVDDHPHLRRLVQTWIEDDDRLLWVGEAEDGESGVALVRTARPDAVVLDVEMPGMGGFGVLDRLRDDHPEVDVVLYSSDPSARDEGLRRGAAAFFVKGDPIRTMLDTIIRLHTER